MYMVFPRLCCSPRMMTEVVPSPTSSSCVLLSSMMLCAEKLAAVHSQRPGRCNPVRGSMHMDCGAALEADGREQTGCARQHSSSCSEPGTRASRRRGRQARLASVRLGKGSRGTLAAGCETSISRRMALPSLVMTMPVSVHIILDERPPDHS